MKIVIEIEETEPQERMPWKVRINPGAGRTTTTTFAHNLAEAFRSAEHYTREDM